MASEADLVSALQKADAAGDHDGAQQIADMIKAQRAGGVPANVPAQPAARPLSSNQQAQVDGLQAGQSENPVLAGISQAAMQGTFGLQNYINAGVRSLAQGNFSKQGYQDNLAYSRAKSQGEAGGSPIASTIGGVAGSVLGGGVLGDAIKVAGKGVPAIARVAEAMTPKTGQAVANVAKSAGINGLIGTGTSLAAGDDPLTAGRNGLVSAVAGPVLGKVAGMTINKLTPVAMRAYQTLAKTMGESPATLAAASQAYTHLTGQQASIAQLAGLKSQGKLKALAAANDEIGTVAAQASDAGGAPLHQQLADVNAAQTNPQSVVAMKALRDKSMTDTMSRPSPTSGNLSLADAPVPLTTQRAVDVLNDPLVTKALRPDTQVSNSAFGPGDLHQSIINDSLTVGDLDHIRLQLRNQQAVNDSPMAGTARNPDVAKAYGAAAQAVEGIAAQAHPAYGAALRQYRQVSRYTTGFNHGLSGESMANATDSDVAKDLAHPSGVGAAGYAHGQALRKAQQALEAIAPGSVKPQSDLGPMDAARVAHAVAAPTPLSIAGIANHLTGTSLPPQAQQIVAGMLFSKDPVRVSQAIANLKRAGMQSDGMRRLAGVIGGVAGQQITAHLDNRDN